MTYAKRLEQETPTRFLVNNPTPGEVRAALDIGGVVGIATNGNYLLRMLTHPETKEDTIALVDRLIGEGVEDDQALAGLCAQQVVKNVAEIILPLFEETEGTLGWTAIQGNPNYDTDYDFIVNEAKRFYTASPNIRCKFPATPAALQGLETCTAMGKATLATCGFSVQYGMDAFEAYQRGCQAFGGPVPQLYVTTLCGHIDEYTEKYLKARGLTLSQAALEACGNQLAKELYRIREERYAGVNARVLGGCRAYYHFTEMVPGDMLVTVNYDFIEMLNEKNLPLDRRIDQYPSTDMLEELRAKLPYFAYMVDPESKIYAHWSEIPTARYFRNYVRRGWNQAVSIIAERRTILR